MLTRRRVDSLLLNIQILNIVLTRRRVDSLLLNIQISNIALTRRRVDSLLFIFAFPLLIFLLNSRRRIPFGMLSHIIFILFRFIFTVDLVTKLLSLSGCWFITGLGRVLLLFDNIGVKILLLLLFISLFSIFSS